MIYLIGGPPKCGKTTLAKKLSKSKEIPWVSTDTLQCVIKPYIIQDEHQAKFPTSAQRCTNNDEKYSKYSTDEIISAYQQQAKTSHPAIDMFALCEMTDGNDFIIEGYHIEPALVAELAEKYPNKIKAIFLVKTNESEFVKNIKKSTTPNDWILARTHQEETFQKIARMICTYSEFFITESEKHEYMVINMDEDFEEKLEQAIKNITN